MKTECSNGKEQAESSQSRPRPSKKVVCCCRFISLPANKSELATFLTHELIRRASELSAENELVLSSGFIDIMQVWSSCRQDINQLSATHEKADTCLLLHAADANSSGYQWVDINSRDIHVLVLVLGLRDCLRPEIWFCSGTSKKRKKYIPVHNILLPVQVMQNIIAFHAMSGCDTTSQFVRTVS